MPSYLQVEWNKDMLGTFLSQRLHTHEADSLPARSGFLRLQTRTCKVPRTSHLLWASLKGTHSLLHDWNPSIEIPARKETNSAPSYTKITVFMLQTLSLQLTAVATELHAWVKSHHLPMCLQKQSLKHGIILNTHQCISRIWSHIIKGGTKFALQATRCQAFT